jgi:hypothetical protein
MKHVRLLRPALVLPLLLVACGDSSTPPLQRPPVLREIILNPETTVPGGQIRVSALASDPDGDPLTYAWTADGGSYSDPTDDTTFWTAPDTAGAYSLVVTITDGMFTVVDSIFAPVGAGSLKVTSDPAGALLVIDGRTTQFVTPHTFDELAIGPHQVRVVDQEFLFSPNFRDVDIAHAQADSVHFRVRQTVFETLNLGRTDIEEIGPVAYLPSGIGILYPARTTVDGVGLYSSAINPQTGQQSGVLLTTNIDLSEAVTVSNDGSWVVYTSPTGNLLANPIQDTDNNGVIDLFGSATLVRTDGYGASMSDENQLVFAFEPSSGTPSLQLFWGAFNDTIGNLSSGPFLATPIPGARPSWAPGSSAIVYETDGFLVFNAIGFGIPGARDTLATPDGFHQMPAWGPFGPTHVAYVSGPDAMNGQRVLLQTATSSRWVSVFDSLFDPRGIAWNPVAPQMVVSHNPGQGRVVLLTNLPIP